MKRRRIVGLLAVAVAVSLIGGGFGLTRWLANRSVYDHSCADGSPPETILLSTEVGAGHGVLFGALVIRLDSDRSGATLTRMLFGASDPQLHLTRAELRALIERVEAPSAFASDIEGGDVEIETECRGTPRHWQYDLPRRHPRFDLSALVEKPFAVERWAALWHHLTDRFTAEHRASRLAAGVAIELLPVLKR